MVDDRIEQIRKERAELEELKDSLKAKEAELDDRENSLDSNGVVLGLVERKTKLEEEINGFTEELRRLKEERNKSITGFGDEMKSIHSGLASETAEIARRLRLEVESLEREKDSLEKDIEAAEGRLADMESRLRREEERLSQEKEALVARKKADSDAALKEISIGHSMALAEQELKRKQLEGDIAELEQQKAIEWSKVEAELARYKSAQFAEIEVYKEQALADAERERGSILGRLKSEEKRHADAIDKLRRDWDNEIQILQDRKQAIENEIELAKYEQEKQSAENVLRAERERAAEVKALHEMRQEAVAKLADEQAELRAQHEKQFAGLRKKLTDARGELEKDVAELSAKKAVLQKDIDVLHTKHEAARAELEASMELFRAEKQREIDTMRTMRIQEMEAACQSRLSKLEAEYEQKASRMETGADMAEKRLRDQQAALEREIEELSAKKFALISDTDELRAKHETQKSNFDADLEAHKLAKTAEVNNMRIGRMQEIEELSKIRLAKLGAEYDAKVAEMEARAEAARKEIGAKREEAVQQIRGLESRKAELESEIDILHTKFDNYKAEVNASMEEHKAAKLREIDELRLARMKEVEAARKEQAAKVEAEREIMLAELQGQQDRARKKTDEDIASMEAEYTKRIEEMDALRKEKHAAHIKAIADAEEQARGLKQGIQALQAELAELTIESKKIKEENEANKSAALLERQMELEKLANQRMAEVEEICAQKIKMVLETERRIDTHNQESEKAGLEKMAKMKEEELELKAGLESLASELAQRRADGLLQVEGEKMEALGEMSKLRLSKMQEIEQELESYKQERFAQAQRDIERQIAAGYKTFEELAALNEEYARKSEKLSELEVNLEAEKRSVYFKEKRFIEEQAQYKSLLQNEMDAHKKEMALLIDTKEQQVSLLQEQLKAYAQEIAGYREEALAEGGKTKKELLSEVFYLNTRIAELTKSLGGKPTDAHIAGMEEKLKTVDALESENKKLALRINGLERERHNWQIAVNEISKLTEEKIMLEERLAQSA